jgi:DNA-binding CsgD family transcriptional regulator/RNA polymerase subunit RPABC4/transcription elongation factor Spt4
MLLERCINPWCYELDFDDYIFENRPLSKGFCPACNAVTFLFCPACPHVDFTKNWSSALTCSQCETNIQKVASGHRNSLAEQRAARQALIRSAGLSPRETDVLELVAAGFSNKEISVKLGISVRTVDAYRTSAMYKTRTHCIAHLIVFAIRHRLISLPKLSVRPRF